MQTMIYKKGSVMAVGYKVRFIDFDGTVLKTEMVVRGDNATPPDLPDYSTACTTRPALTFQGWNNDYTNVTSDIDIGAVWIPADGKTHLFITLNEATGLSPKLLVYKLSSTPMTIDLGNGSQITTYSGIQNVTLNYSQYGSYEVIISDSSTYTLGHNDVSTGIFTNAAQYKNILQAAYLGNSVGGIANYTFANCQSLKVVTIPQHITNINHGAFVYCYSLQCAVIPGQVSVIASWAFNSCYAMHEAILPRQLYSIGNQTFLYCISLESIVLPPNLELIYEYAFQHCYSLSYIKMQNKVFYIGIGAFEYCYALKEMTLSSNVVRINENLFNECRSLQTLNIGTKSLEIGAKAFCNCHALKEIKLPMLVSNIGPYAFYNCYSLTSLILPERLMNIGNEAFSACYSLDRIVFPSTMTTIGNSIFNLCYRLSEIVLKSTNPPALSANNNFIKSNNTYKIYVPDESVDLYKTAANWTAYANHIRPMSELVQ